MDVMLAMKKAFNERFACGFNGETDQLDRFHVKHCMLDDLIHAVG